MATIELPYPKVLTNSDWQDKKGAANRGKRTGIDEGLAALEKAFAASPYGKLDPDALAAETLDPVLFNKKFEAMKKSLVLARRKLVFLATETEKRIVRSLPLFAESSNEDVRKHLGDMRQALKKLQTDIAEYQTALETATRFAYKERLHSSKLWQLYVMGAPATHANANKMVNVIKQLEADPKIANIHKLFGAGANAPGQALATSFKHWDQLVRDEVPELAKQLYPASATDTVGKLPWLTEVGNEASSQATNAVKKLAQGSSEARAVQKFALELSRSFLEARTKFLAAYLKAAKTLQSV
jgi:hypothetical protein